VAVAFGVFRGFDVRLMCLTFVLVYLVCLISFNLFDVLICDVSDV